MGVVMSNKIEEKVIKNKYKLDKEYLQKILDSIDIPDSTVDPLTHGDKLIISVLVQQNLLLARLTDLLMIATGLTPYTDNKLSDDIFGVGHDIPGTDHDIPDASDDKDEVIDKALSKSVVCGHCGFGVVPNKLGYCPKCMNDLKLQIAQELLNKKQ